MNKLEMLETSIKSVATMCVSSRVSRRHKLHLKKSLAKLMLLHSYMIEEPKRRLWVRPIFTVQQRMFEGDGDNLLEMLKSTDPKLYFSYLRMSPEVFEELFKLIGQKIEKQICVREPINARTRLQIYLRYLASGNTMQSVGYAFRVAPNTVSKIISELCPVITDVLKEIVMPTPNYEDWKKIANDFNSSCNFPNCIGAFDERYVPIQTAAQDESINHKSRRLQNIIITGIADINYCFTLVNIGSDTSQVEGIFSESNLKSKLDSDELNIPPPTINYHGELPYVFVASEAYPLSKYMLRPYNLGQHSDFKNRVFNFRLSQARKVIDTAFNLLAARWHILKRPMLRNVEKAQETILALICLHNFIIKQEQALNQKEYSKYTDADKEDQSSILKMLKQKPNNKCQPIDIKYRDTFAQYFMDEGAVDWQWEKALTDDF